MLGHSDWRDLVAVNTIDQGALQWGHGLALALVDLFSASDGIEARACVDRVMQDVSMAWTEGAVRFGSGVEAAAGDIGAFAQSIDSQELNGVCEEVFVLGSGLALWFADEIGESFVKERPGSC